MSAPAATVNPPRTLGSIPEYRGLLSWVSSVDHKQIGLMYLLTASSSSASASWKPSSCARS